VGRLRYLPAHGYDRFIAVSERRDSPDGGTTARELDVVRALELRLLDPAVRGRPAEVERLLHPEFVEIGASGRRWERREIVEVLRADPGESPRVSDLAVQALSPDTVLVTYRAERSTPEQDASLRASLWLRDAHGWRVRFHQGTPAARSR
jgi:ribonuclease HI